MSDSSRLEQGGGQSAAVDRRASIRYLCQRKTALHGKAFGKEQRWPGTVRDISKEGIGLTLDQQFDAGTLLGVELTNPDADISYTIIAKVMHTEPAGDGNWRAGCLFVRKLTDQELQSLL